MKIKYTNASFFFVTDDGAEYGVHFQHTKKQPGKGRGEQTVTYTKNGKFLGQSLETRGNHNKSNALYFLKIYLTTL